MAIRSNLEPMFAMEPDGGIASARLCRCLTQTLVIHRDSLVAVASAFRYLKKLVSDEWKEVSESKTTPERAGLCSVFSFLSLTFIKLGVV